MTLSVGSCFSGTGGLDMAVELALGPVRHAWHVENDADASAVLAANWPGVPNHDDITALDFAGLPEVDILTAGYPCQGESSAGLRKGTDDPRWLWPHVKRAIRDLGPRLVVLENVRGHVGRGLKLVIADLAALGYVGSWTCVRASDVGAPHRRERVCVVAWPADSDPGRWADLARADDTRPAGTGPGGGLTLLPTPNASRVGSRIDTQLSGDGRERPNKLGWAIGALALLPTPSARDGRRGAGWGDLPGRPLSETIHRLLPTPTVNDSRNATAGRSEGAQFNTGWTLSDVAYAEKWREYAPAIARWEQVIGRPAPEPTVPGRTGKPALSPLFVEWMMGLPEGHVTKHVPTVNAKGQRRTEASTRTVALRLLGNGAVPLQLAHGIRTQMSALTGAVAA